MESPILHSCSEGSENLSSCHEEAQVDSKIPKHLAFGLDSKIIELENRDLETLEYLIRNAGSCMGDKAAPASTIGRYLQ